MGLPPDLQQHLSSLRKAEEVFVRPLMGVLASLDYIAQSHARISQVDEQKVKIERELTDAQEKLREYREQLEKFPAILRQKREEFNAQVQQARRESDEARQLIASEIGDLRDEVRNEREVLKGIRQQHEDAQDHLVKVRSELSKIAQMAG